MLAALVLHALLVAGAAANLRDTAMDRDSDSPVDAVPVDQEPKHKLVFRNDYVEVLHVTIPGGQSTRFHTHSHDGAAVRLSDATISTDVPGKGPTAAQHVRPGDVSVAAYAARPLTHRVNNVGRTAFEVIDLEFLKRPDGPAAQAIAAPVAENETARIYRWALPPGASSPQHVHERPYLIIAATPMQLRMAAPDGATIEHAVQAGDFHWIDGTVNVTHTLTNPGPEPGIIVEVELK
jgi:uncharacterized cupin superfamily protein